MVRAFVIKFIGQDGTRCSVIFDRYGMNASLFSISQDTDTLRNHAISNAITAVLRDKGTDWIKTYKVIDVPSH